MYNKKPNPIVRFRWLIGILAVRLDPEDTFSSYSLLYL